MKILKQKTSFFPAQYSEGSDSSKHLFPEQEGPGFYQFQTGWNTGCALSHSSFSTFNLFA